MTKWNIIKHRLKEICPHKRVVYLSYEDIFHSIKIAFEIIGYVPVNLYTAIVETSEDFNGIMLYEFIYEVYWRDTL